MFESFACKLFSGQSNGGSKEWRMVLLILFKIDKLPKCCTHYSKQATLDLTFVDFHHVYTFR
jgi:hypothetical protein